jgi:hypothetical protein
MFLVSLIHKTSLFLKIYTRFLLLPGYLLLASPQALLILRETLSENILGCVQVSVNRTVAAVASIGSFADGHAVKAAANRAQF